MKKSERENQLMQLFENELSDIYWVEKALVKAIPKMIDNAYSQELIGTLTSHLAETEIHISRLVQVFGLIGKDAVAKKCEAMAGLIEEVKHIMVECEEGVVRDAGIISAGQKIEHYEIATYGTLRQFAEVLGLNDAVILLQKTLDEEKKADEKLTKMSVSLIHFQEIEV